VREPLWVLVHHLFDKTIFREVSFLSALYVYLAEKLGVSVVRWKKTPVMVVSESTKTEMAAKGISESLMSMVPNCVDHEIHTPGSEKDRSPVPLIGYFGRLKKYKSADHLLRAFKKIVPAHPDLKLVIIGEGDYRKTLEELSNELGISSSVTFTGFIPIEEKVVWLRKMWYMVNTSAKEGWGLTVIEANACGTTVIASNVPGLRDAVKNKETGILYEYGNIDELAQWMETLLNDSELRDRLSKNAVVWSRRFDWNVVARETADILQHGVRTSSVSW
jgi:glycosyltransferase involved in cell wall biosynthesis